MTKKPPAIEAAQDQKGPVEIERGGVRAELRPVPEGVIEEAASRLQPPPVPIVRNEDGTEYENPNDPAYLHELKQLNITQARIGMETVVLHGIHLLDPVPDESHEYWGDWERKLRFQEKRGHLDLSWLDWEDDFEREYAFKRYAYALTEDIAIIGQLSGLTSEAVKAAESTFRGNEKR